MAALSLCRPHNPLHSGVSRRPMIGRALGEFSMKKALIAIAAIAAIGFTTLAASTDEAAAQRYRRGNVGAGIAAGIIGGAIIGGAIANSGAYAYPRAYYPVTGYEPYPVYGVRAPYACPGGYWARR